MRKSSGRHERARRPVPSGSSWPSARRIRSCPSVRRVYRSSVVDERSCPITCWTMFTGTPSSTSHVAQERRSPWKTSPPAATREVPDRLPFGGQLRGVRGAAVVGPRRAHRVFVDEDEPHPADPGTSDAARRGCGTGCAAAACRPSCRTRCPARRRGTSRGAPARSAGARTQRDRASPGRALGEGRERGLAAHLDDGPDHP
jgi:hypothetical protein